MVAMSSPSDKNREQIWLSAQIEAKVEEILKELGAYEKGVQKSTSVGGDNVVIKVVVPLKDCCVCGRNTIYKCTGCDRGICRDCASHIVEYAVGGLQEIYCPNCY
jgi:hypothetical protein